MTDTNNEATKRRLPWLPQLRSRWWTALLGVSLMANLLIGGLVLGQAWRLGPESRMAGASYVQLVPRSFFRNLSGERRKELMQIVRDNRDDLRNLRDQFESSGLKLADALEKDNFSIEDVRSTVTSFTTGTESLAARGGEVVVKIVASLTAEERKQLAQAIRDRDARTKKKKRD
jgi:uncharacterized membrane protein